MNFPASKCFGTFRVCCEDLSRMKSRRPEIPAVLQLLLKDHRSLRQCCIIYERIARHLSKIVNSFALRFRINNHRVSRTIRLTKAVRRDAKTSRYRVATRCYNSLKLFKRRYQIRTSACVCKSSKTTEFRNYRGLSTVKPLIRGGESSIGR